MLFFFQIMRESFLLLIAYILIFILCFYIFYFVHMNYVKIYMRSSGNIFKHLVFFVAGNFLHYYVKLGTFLDLKLIADCT